MKSATMTADGKIIFDALRSYKRLAGMFKRGGCIESYKEAQAALDAWERLQEAKKPKQLKLGGCDG